MCFFLLYEIQENDPTGWLIRWPPFMMPLYSLIHSAVLFFFLFSFCASQNTLFFILIIITHVLTVCAPVFFQFLFIYFSCFDLFQVLIFNFGFANFRCFIFSSVCCCYCLADIPFIFAGFIHSFFFHALMFRWIIIGNFFLCPLCEYPKFAR